MKNNFFNKVLVVLFIFIICFVLFPIQVKGFSEREQAEIDEVVTTLVNNSKNNGVTYAIDLNSSSTRVAFFQADAAYKGTVCKYIVVMYWENQFNITFTNGTLVATHNTGGNNEICYYHYDENLKLIDAVSRSFSSINNGYITSTGLVSCFYSKFTLYDSSGNLVELSYNSSFVNPSFITTQEELVSGIFDTLKIDAGSLDYSDSNGKILLNIYDCITVTEGVYNYSVSKSILLDYSSKYIYIDNLDFYYYIPKANLGIDFSNDKHYLFQLEDYGGDTVYSSIDFTVGGLTVEEEQENYDDLTHEKMDEQTGAIKEQTEVNKNIFQSIGEVLSYINPFSENFFVYKMLELLGELLKSLFVPSEEYLSQWFTDVSSYFEEAFGILYYPVDLVISVLGRFDGIEGQEPVITFGDLKLFNVVLIAGFTYNFNDILVNDTFANIHNFYLITVDVILWLGLLVYCKNVIANIFGGKFTDDVIDEIQDSGGYNRTANNISRYTYAKEYMLRHKNKRSQKGG